MLKYDDYIFSKNVSHELVFKSLITNVSQVKCNSMYGFK